ncbi:MAG: hypothetical protein F4038_00080 [Chloroflexi bacterium]|nr:hypothetical protein [Chloroflexota bacterium]MYA02868.1 hypothetical protein [Chloroflexota bacterium]MYD53063.1 hypothetical protein [Chloroflexota bacterium]MYJ91436.1 hypothetical protein [Chloroflexota bacterium]
MTIEQVVHYQELSAEYLRHARSLLAEGDLTQASEKGWGAASVLVKAAAESREVAHEKHRHLWQTIRVLVRETDDAELRSLFSHAESLHGNYYEDMLDAEEVAEFLGDVERLVEKLRALV